MGGGWWRAQADGLGGITRLLCAEPARLHPQSRDKALTAAITAQTMLSLGLKVTMGGGWGSSVLNSKRVTKRGEAGPQASCRG